MDDKYTEFSDFFKKKLKEAELNKYDWDKPDEAVKEALLQRLSNETTVSKVVSTKLSFYNWALLTLTFLTFLFLGSYVIHLSKKNNALQKALQSKSVLNEKLTLEEIKQQHTQELTALLQEKKIEKQSAIKIKEENTVLKKQLDQQESLLAQLNNEIRLFAKAKQSSYSQERTDLTHLKNIKALKNQLDEYKHQMSQYKLMYADIASEQKIITQTEELKPSALASNNEEEKVSAVRPLPKLDPTFFSGRWLLLRKWKDHLPVAYKQKRKRFELGYSFTFSSPDNLIESSLQNKDGYTYSFFGRGVSSNPGFHGLQIGYSPCHKLWIKTGISISSKVLVNYFNTNVKYYNFKEGEVFTQDRTVQNQLSFSSKSEYAQTSNPISFEFDIGDLLPNDDMDIRIKERQQLNYYRIPLGLEYYYGKKKLKGSIAGGFRLTRISGNTQTIQADVNAQRGIIKTSYINKAQAIQPKHFVNLYAGLGLDYQLLQKLNIRSSVSLHQKFTDRNIYSTPQTVDLNLGLHYQF